MCYCNHMQSRCAHVSRKTTPSHHRMDSGRQKAASMESSGHISPRHPHTHSICKFLKLVFASGQMDCAAATNVDIHTVGHHRRQLTHYDIQVSQIAQVVLLWIRYICRVFVIRYRGVQRICPQLTVVQGSDHPFEQRFKARTSLDIHAKCLRVFFESLNIEHHLLPYPLLISPVLLFWPSSEERERCFFPLLEFSQ